MSDGGVGSGRSAALGAWQAVERDLRAFLRVGLRFSADAHERLWERAGAGAGGGRSQLDLYEQLIDGVRQQDYAWMHELAVLGDAVANYEVYVERAHAELLGSRGGSLGVAGHGALGALPTAPSWEQLTRFFARLDVDVEPPPVQRVRRLRRLLTHQRAELRSEPLRQDPPAAAGVALDEHVVVEALDALAKAVRAADPVVAAHAAGRRPLPDWS